MNKTITSARQGGVAMIMFVIMLPALMGMLVLGVEGARFLRVKADVGNAAEVASLALSARDELDAAKNRELARAYIEAQVPDATISEVKVYRIDCEDNPNECHPGQPDRFTEYQVSAVATFQSWFPGFSDSGFGFEKEVRVSTRAVSRKYQGIGAVDVFLVADFSGSMNFPWNCTRCSENPNDPNNRLNLLRAIVKDVSTELEKQSELYGVENTVALVPFNMTTRAESANGICRTQQAIHYFDVKNVADLFVEKGCSDHSVSGDNARFHTVESTTDYQMLIDQMGAMTAHHGTASFEGIIRAAQLANRDYPELKNPRRLIIVLSDGEDSHDAYLWQCAIYNDNSSDCSDGGWGMRRATNIHEGLLKNNYCDKIRNELNKLTVRDRNDESQDIQVQSKIAAIGFGSGYDIAGNAYINQCAGTENVYMADNDEEIRRLILYLIAEEVGHLYNRDYTSR